MALSALMHIWRDSALIHGKLASILALHFGCAMAAFLLALWCIGKVLGEDRRFGRRFAAAFVFLSGLTIGLTALVFALIYRSAYAQWHGPPLSAAWTEALVFTIAGAVYQFLVLGLRHYVPLGFAALVAASLVLACRCRTKR